MMNRAVAGISAALLVWCLQAVCCGWVPVSNVSASASWDEDHGARRASDQSTQETPNGGAAWLLPDGKTGEIRFDFGSEFLLTEVHILNTRNRLYFDRATSKFRFAVVEDGITRVVAGGTLPAYPEWKIVPLAGRPATSAILYVDSFTGAGGGLSEVSFRGVPAGGARLLPLLLAVVFGGIVAGFYPALSIHLQRRKSMLLLATLLAAMSAIGLRALHGYTAVSVFEWLLLYDVREFRTLAQTWRFLCELRIPIPPWLAVLEIGAQSLTGNIDLISRDFYLLSIIGGNALAVVLAYPSTTKMIVTALAAVICIVGTGPVHQANPQIYDTAFGFLLILFISLLEWSARSESGSRKRSRLLGAAGIVLSLWGLTRPFAILLMPLPIIFVVLRFPDQRWRGWVTFLAPVVLLFGLWHAQLYWRHDQIGISNHSGFNLHRAWPMVEVPRLVQENDAPPFRGANNPDHAVNSKILQRAVVKYVVAHPRRALLHVLERMNALLDARTDFPDRQAPKGPIIAAYQIVVRILMVLTLCAFLVRGAEVLRGELSPFRREQMRVSDLALLLLVGIMLLLAIGESGEESRFIVSFLPLLVSILASSEVATRDYPFSEVEGQIDAH